MAGCLCAINYDPGTAATYSTAALSVMAAMDTTNLRLSVTVPPSGKVTVRIRCTVHGATTFPAILLGVLEGTTIRGRVAPIGAMKATALATQQLTQEACYTLTGLTPGTYNWDCAWATQVAIASTGIKCGGPNNTTTNDSFGAVTFEVWDATRNLGAVLYDPAAAVSKSTASLLAMTAIDTTNARITFTAPPSGKVLVRGQVCETGATTYPAFHLGVLTSSTVTIRQSPIGGIKATAVASNQNVYEFSAVISELSGSVVWDMAYAVDIVLASTNIKYGGPNNTSGNNAWGALVFEVWPA